MSMIRAITTVGGYTMVSRVLGFVRDVLIARVLGTGEMARRLLRLPSACPICSAACSPKAPSTPPSCRRSPGGSRRAARNPPGRFAEQVMSVLLSVLLAFTILAQIFMPALMHLIAPGFVGRPAKFAMAVQFTQVCFPYLLFMSLTALQGGDPEFARPLRPCGGRPDHAERHHDPGAGVRGAFDGADGPMRSPGPWRLPASSSSCGW